MPGVLEHLAQNGRAVDAVLGSQPLPLPIGRVDAAGATGEAQEQEERGEGREERGEGMAFSRRVHAAFEVCARAATAPRLRVGCAFDKPVRFRFHLLLHRVDAAAKNVFQNS